ncbi:MAG: PKD domain-containing protein, partial [Cyclobacteriaceae bacterium]
TIRDEEAPEIDIDFSFSRCVNTDIDLSTVSNQSLVSYEWSFDDGNSATIPAPTHQYAAEGSYEVVVEVEAENGCSNFAQKEINIYNAPIADFELPETLACSNSSIQTTNTTTTSAPDSLLMWQWNFNGEANSNLQNPAYTFTSGGDKNISLTAGIPGCSHQIQKNIFITAGPSVDFNWTGNCLGEDFAFNNLTTGERISGYNWDFGNGYFAATTHPEHEYEAAGTYQVKLKAQNEEGCETERSKTLFVRDIPSIDFEWELPCNKNPVQIYDRSTVQFANISQRFWTWTPPAGDVETAQFVDNPFFTPEISGTHTLKLVAESNFGCKDSLVQSIQVLPAPEVDFTTLELCAGRSAIFEAEVELESGSISRYDWIIDGNLHTGPIVTRTFPAPKAFNASLVVRADNLCTGSISKNLNIFPTPVPAIAHGALCTNEASVFTATVQSQDPVVAYEWSVNNVLSGVGSSFIRQFQTQGSHNIAVQVNTLNGCTGRIEQAFTIARAPVASFEAFPAKGARPLPVSFYNNSQFADQYQWTFKQNSSEQSTAFEPQYTYVDEATERAQLIAMNNAGCRDTAYAYIEILQPFLDVALLGITTAADQDKLSFNLEIKNKGSVIINDLDILARLGSSVQLYDNLSTPLYADQQISHTLSFSLRQQVYTDVHHVCFTLQPNAPGLQDENPDNNSECISLSGLFQLLDLYPNPVVDQVHIPFIIPTQDEIRFRIVDSRGSQIASKSYTQLKPGLNVIEWNTVSLAAGVYIIQITYKEKQLSKKMVVR